MAISASLAWRGYRLPPMASADFVRIGFRCHLSMSPDGDFMLILRQLELLLGRKSVSLDSRTIFREFIHSVLCKLGDGIRAGLSLLLCGRTA